MMNAFKKTIAATLAITVIGGTMMTGSVNDITQDIFPDTTISADAATGDKRLINQWALKDTELKYASCFQSSLANGIWYASNGAMRLTASDISYLCRNSGAWTAQSGTWRDPMITFIDKSGLDDKYRIKIYKGIYTKVSNAEVKKWLSSSRENIMIAHVKGHFIALLSYDYKTNKFLVSDSVVYNGTNGRNLPAFGWVSEKKLKSGSTNVDWVCKITYKGVDNGTDNKTDNNSGSKTNKKVSYFKKYTGKSGSIVDALCALNVNSSFSYRAKIYKANSDLVKKYGKTYSGSSKQNTAMVAKLRKGALVKP